MERDVRELLKFIDPAACDYLKWLSVGMALYNVSPAPDMLALWDRWSSEDRGTARDGSPRYKTSGPYSCAEKWKTFHSDPGGFSMGTLVQYAKEGGYDAKAFPVRKDKALAEGAVINETPAEKKAGLTPCEQLRKYIETLFEPEDFVGYVTESAYVSQGRWVPDRGVYTRTAGEILDAIKAHPEDLTKAVGRWHEECGAWIRVNALNGQGVRNADVKSFRYALVESDTEPVDKQCEVYERLRLPIACLVSSGGKSLHAIVRIDAENLTEYGRRVDFLYGKLKEEGLSPDRSDRNPSRLSRMPGVTRRGVEQTLLGTNLGLKDFHEWKIFTETGKTPPRLTQPAKEMIRKPLPPAMIEGVLQFGHKMIISGPSKAGKSFFAIELGLCVSEGKEFLGFKTTKAKVLYINLEISEEFFSDRVFAVAEKLGLLGSENFYALSLRGASRSVDGLVSDLIRDYKEQNFKCVIIDPVYKIMPGDENSPDVATRLTNQLDRLSNALGSSVIYVHHHSKGAQGGKSALDRASGSGVLTRDADEIFDLTEVDVPESQLKEAGLNPTATVWELSIESRDYGRTMSKKVSFDYPLHRGDDGHFFDGYRARGSVAAFTEKARPGKQRTEEKPASKRNLKREGNEEELDAAFDALGAEAATVAEIAKVLAEDSSSAEYPATLAAKKSMVYRLCESSIRFSLEDGIVKRTQQTPFTK